MLWGFQVRYLGKRDSKTIGEAAKLNQSQLFPFINAAVIQSNLLTETQPFGFPFMMLP